jgi:hypothetical protein
MMTIYTFYTNSAHLYKTETSNMKVCARMIRIFQLIIELRCKENCFLLLLCNDVHFMKCFITSGNFVMWPTDQMSGVSENFQDYQGK